MLAKYLFFSNKSGNRIENGMSFARKKSLRERERKSGERCLQNGTLSTLQFGQ